MALNHVLIVQPYSTRRELQESYLNIFYLPIFYRFTAYRSSKKNFGPNVIYCFLGYVDIVWRYHMELSYGDIIWRYHMVISYGDIIWWYRMVISYGDIVWRYHTSNCPLRRAIGSLVVNTIWMYKDRPASEHRWRPLFRATMSVRFWHQWPWNGIEIRLQTATFCPQRVPSDYHICFNLEFAVGP